MIIREIPADERKLAALKAIAWGFPRPIEWREWADGVWITDEPQTGIAWLVKGPLHENHWLLHAQTAPHTGVRLPSPDVLRAIRVTAGLLGATRVYAGLGEMRPGWRRWLMRSGFFEKQDAVGPWMDLEGS